MDNISGTVDPVKWRSAGAAGLRSFTSSIRGRLLILLLAFSATVTALGGYVLNEIHKTGDLVVETYNKPLMAINFARSALFAFSSMQRSLARAHLSRHPATRKFHVAQFEDGYRLFTEDLRVARDRSLSPKARALADELFGMVEGWRQGVHPSGEKSLDATAWQALDEHAARIVDRFNFLIDQTAGDAFVLRQDALKSIDRLGSQGDAIIVALIVLSILIAILFGQSVIRPINAAIQAARDIARGKFNARLPDTACTEMRLLMRSISVMQDNIRSMMDREEALRKSAQMRMVDALESCPEGVILFDDADRIVFSNSQIAQFFPAVDGFAFDGAGAADFFGHIARSDALAPDAGDREAFLSCCQTARRSGDSAIEIRLAAERSLRMGFSRTRDDGIVLFISDITELIERENLLRLAKDEAEAASRAKSDFLANMSHELRTPLNAVIGFSDFLVSELYGPLGHGAYREYARHINDSGSHLLRVINDILDLSKIEAGKLSPALAVIDPRHAVQSSTGVVGMQAQENAVALAVEIADDLPVIVADERMLKQILMNLLSNAVKFTAEGGRVRLSVAADAGHELLIRVQDTGIGMTGNEIATALEPFGQVDGSLSRRFEGTGLGLPLVKRMVELHGGVLSIDSAPGAGTTVEVRLPRITAKPDAADPPAAAAGGRSLSAIASGPDRS